LAVKTKEVEDVRSLQRKIQSKMEAILRNDAIKGGLKIPLYYGTPKEDTMDITMFIKRFENATAAMGNLQQADKCQLFGNYLRGAAVRLWDNLPDVGTVNTANWNEVKTYFIEMYKGVASGTKIVNKISNLIFRLVIDLLPIDSFLHF